MARPISSDTRSNEQSYLPLVSVWSGIGCIAVAIILFGVSMNNSVALWLFELFYAVSMSLGHRGRGTPTWSGLSGEDQQVLLVLSFPFFVFGVLRLLQAILGFPRVVVTNDGLVLKTIFRTKWANWQSLTEFEIKRGWLPSRKAVAAVVGQTAMKSHCFGRRFTIHDAFSVPLDLVVTELNARRAQSRRPQDKAAASE